MNFIKKLNNPAYNLFNAELKIMRAIWLKNAPMSYEEILGACVSDYWIAENAQGWIDHLLSRGLITRLDSGRYDAVLKYEEYEKYLKRRKIYLHFYPDPPRCLRPSSEGPDYSIDEYTLRQLEKMVDEMKARRESESDSPLDR